MSRRVTAPPYPDVHGARPPADPQPVEGRRLHQLPAGLPLLADRAPARAAVAPRCQGHPGARRAGGALLAPFPRVADASRGARRARALLGGAASTTRSTSSSRSTPTRQRPSWPTPARLVDNYFRLEDPNEARAVGIELGVETAVDGMRLRGVIDRLDVTDDGSLIVVDYKTGRAPSERFERGSMGGVQTYALLVREPARACPDRGPAALPAPAHRHLVGGLRTDHPWPAPTGRRRVVCH